MTKCLGALSRDRLFWLALFIPVPFWFGLFLFADKLGITQTNILSSQYLALVFLYPLIEEIVFRGLIQEALQKRLKWSSGPITAANLLTSIAFTALHFFYHAPVWAMSVFIPSLIFGFFKERHQSLVPAIILHVFYNGGYYTLFG